MKKRPKTPRGIIPAYAGNTRKTDVKNLIKRDHPRVCGEHHIVGYRRAYWTGIIPAYAGNTYALPKLRTSPRDHPRVCGEHALHRLRGCHHRGSSPRMRGTLAPCRAVATEFGIIPAYAGNTVCNGWTVKRVWDHPRVCGEHQDDAWCAERVPGSSPRMRGTHHQRHRKTRRPGIIPAYAGNTMLWIWLPQHKRDHPRVCGEHLLCKWSYL